MTFHQRALPPVQAQPRVLVHPAADRRLATEHWLLSTLPEVARDRARQEWTDHRIAMLPLGGLFSAVRMPAHVVHAVAGGNRASRETDGFLEAALDGGPVICDPHGRRYYALVPASTPRTWTAAIDEWRDQEVDCLGRESYLGVPRLDVTEEDPTIASYWSVPMSSAATLCAPLTVARLIATAAHMLWTEANDAQD